MLKQLLNTLYVQAQGAYVRLDHETLKLEVERDLKLQVPLQHLGGMALFGNVLVSPFLIHRFAEDGRSIAWFGTTGRFKGRLAGPTTGNVLLRRAQYEAQADPERTAAIARSIVAGKVRNTRSVVQRAARETASPEDGVSLEKTAMGLASVLKLLPGEPSVDGIRGLEGQAGRLYFESFAAMVRVENEAYAFNGRNRRPPRDRVNALLSFVYALVLGDCVAACEPFAGVAGNSAIPKARSCSVTALRRARASASTRSSATCTPCVPDVPRSPSTCKKSCVLSSPTGSRSPS